MGCNVYGACIGLNKCYSTGLHDFCRCFKLESESYFLVFLKIRIYIRVLKYTLKTNTIKCVVDEMA